jgi:hypothetical protein
MRKHNNEAVQLTQFMDSKNASASSPKKRYLLNESYSKIIKSPSLSRPGSSKDVFELISPMKESQRDVHDFTSRRNISRMNFTQSLATAQHSVDMKLIAPSLGTSPKRDLFEANTHLFKPIVDEGVGKSHKKVRLEAVIRDRHNPLSFYDQKSLEEKLPNDGSNTIGYTRVWSVGNNEMEWKECRVIEAFSTGQYIVSLGEGKKVVDRLNLKIGNEDLEARRETAEKLRYGWLHRSALNQALQLLAPSLNQSLDPPEQLVTQIMRK